MHGGKRPGAGRKPVNIDLEQLEKLSAIRCTDEDLAGFFGVSVRTIERRRQGYRSFAAAMQRGRAKGRISLRRQLHLLASQGNLLALKFLAKNELGYHDAPGAQPTPPDADVPKPRFKGTYEELLQLHWQTNRGSRAGKTLVKRVVKRRSARSKRKRRTPVSKPSDLTNKRSIPE